MNCTECAKNGTETTATHRFVWGWGEEGFCCDSHRTILQQHADHLKRDIVFSSLEKRAYEAPKLTELDASAMDAKLAELQADNRAKNARLADFSSMIDRHLQEIARLQNLLTLHNIDFTEPPRGEQPAIVETKPTTPG